MSALYVPGVLDAAADLLERKGWTQGVYARGPNGRMTYIADPKACSFCLRGALVRVGAVGPWDEQSPATRALGFATAKKMTTWNDRSTRTREQVLTRVREAAQAARSSGGEA